MPRNTQRRDGGTQARDDNLVLDMLKGAAAGVVATWVMDRVDWFMYEREPKQSQRQTWAVRPEHKDPAHVIASRTSQVLGGEAIPQDHAAGLAVHYAIGVAPAALYGAMRGRVPGVGAGRGLAYGMAMFILEDEIANPLAGFAAAPQRYPWQPHVRGLVSHLVYGFVTDLLLRAMTPRTSQRKPRPKASASPQMSRGTPEQSMPPQPPRTSC